MPLDPAQSAAATGDPEGTTQQQGTTQSGQQQRPAQTRRQIGDGEGSVLDAVLRDMADAGEVPVDVLEEMNRRRKPAPQQPPANLADRRREQIAAVTGQPTGEEIPPAEEEIELDGEEVQPSGEEETQGQPEATQEEEVQTPGEETPTLFESDEPLGEEWTPEQRAQILDGRRKLRTRTQELNSITAKADELLARAQNAEAQLQAGPPREMQPTFDDPLPDVMNPQQLEAAQRTWKQAKRWAEDHPEGAEKGVDKGPQGEELTQDWSAQDVLEVKRRAEDILEEAVPKRRDWIQQAAVHTRQAIVEYPELFKDTPESHQAAEILAIVPELKRVPNFMLWIGRAVTGRLPKGSQPTAAAPAKGANGKPLSQSAQTILNAPRLSPAPGATRIRAVETVTRTPKSRVETTKEARKELIESNLTDKDLERYIAKRLSARPGKGGREAVLA